MIVRRNPETVPDAEMKDVSSLAVDVAPGPSLLHDEHEIPDGGYGWICVLSVFTVNSFTWGAAAQSYGVFLGYYLSHDVFPTASPIDYAFIGGFNLCMAMLVAPLVTVAVRCWGTKIPMLIGITLQTSGFVLASFTNEIWQLYITQGALVGFGIGFTYIPSTAVISQWFLKRRGFATALTATGSGFGGIVFSFATQGLIDKISLPWALRIIGLISGSLNLVATALIRDRNNIIQPTLAAFDTKLLRHSQPLLLLAWVFVINFGYTCLLYSLPDFALSIGLNANQAALISVYMNVSTAVGRALVGFLSDRFGILRVTGIFTLWTGIATFAIWIPADSYGITIFFALATGGTLGIVWPACAPICAKIVGLKDLPSMLSLSWLTSVLPLAFSEVIALKLRRPDASLPYLYPQIFAGVSYLASAVIMLTLYLVHRKHGPIA